MRQRVCLGRTRLADNWLLSVSYVDPDLLRKIKPVIMSRMKTTTFKRTPGAKWIEDEQIMCVKEEEEKNSKNNPNPHQKNPPRT